MNFPCEKSMQLYKKLIKCGYSDALSYVIVTRQMNTDYTAGRLLGYLNQQVAPPPEEELIDEMLAILSDRERFIKKHITENSQQIINEYYESARNSFPPDEDDR